MPTIAEYLKYANLQMATDVGAHPILTTPAR
jgi:hypothetical protein